MKHINECNVTLYLSITFQYKVIDRTFFYDIRVKEKTYQYVFIYNRHIPRVLIETKLLSTCFYQLHDILACCL